MYKQKLIFTISFFALFLLMSDEAVSSKPDQGIKPTDQPLPPDPAVEDCKKCMFLTDISQQRIILADVASKSIIWEWKPEQSNIKEAHKSWFINYSDIKPVYNNKFLLISSSAGGVALIRIADKKAIFYAFAGGNTHSIELLPDGNIVSASSTGNYLTIFNVDTLSYPDHIYKQNIPIESGHNVVWDQKNNILWSAAMNQLKAFQYNFDCKRPNLTLKNSYNLMGTNVHDLFPVYGENALWVSTESNVYKFDVRTKKLTLSDEVLIQKGIKSISSGPKDFPTIVSIPKEKWWTDEIFDSRGNTVFFQAGLKIYKARWFLENHFSYPANDTFRQCK